MTRQGIYPSVPAPNGVPWSEYVQTHRNEPPSVSSSTEALESDHARYVTRKIMQHARSMVTRTRSLPTDSPTPYFQPIEKGFVLDGSQEGIYATPHIEPPKHMFNIGGTNYQSDITGTHGVSTFTGLDDYDILFAARHGRGALDLVSQISELISTSTPMAGPELINPMEKEMPAQSDAHINQKEVMQSQIVSPSSEIIGESAAIFTDMTETILGVLDKQAVVPPGSQQPTKGLPTSQKVFVQSEKPRDSTQKDGYPDLFLPIRENYRISDHFCGYSDSLSANNNPMVLVELNNLALRYGTSIYTMDTVNGTMYGKFSIGYRVIPEKATIIPQYQHATMETEHVPTYENTFPEITNLPTSITKSTPVTQALHIPVTKPSTERDIVHPIFSEEARATYLENQMKHMDSV